MGVLRDGGAGASLSTSCVALTVSQVEALLNWLNGKGVRELALKNAIAKWRGYIMAGCRKRLSVRVLYPSCLADHRAGCETRSASTSACARGRARRRADARVSSWGAWATPSERCRPRRGRARPSAGRDGRPFVFELPKHAWASLSAERRASWNVQSSVPPAGEPCEQSGRGPDDDVTRRILCESLALLHTAMRESLALLALLLLGRASGQTFVQPQVCARWSGSVAVAQGRAYYYGGEATLSPAQTSGRWTNALLSLALNTSFSLGRPPLVLVTPDSGNYSSPPAVACAYDSHA